MGKDEKNLSGGRIWSSKFRRLSEKGPSPTFCRSSFQGIEKPEKREPARPRPQSPMIFGQFKGLSLFKIFNKLVSAFRVKI
jgi:hypothetical protein